MGEGRRPSPIRDIPLTEIDGFPNHPFQVRDDEEMKETIQSVKEYGVIVPAIVRPREEGGYEIVWMIFTSIC